MNQKKKLIEVALPLEAINVASAREKSIRHGHPSTLHLWWARRPLAAARAVIFAQLVDDPSAHPERFPTEEEQNRERQRLFLLIEELVKWENTTNEKVLQLARDEIWKSWRATCAENADHPRAKELFDPDKLPAFHDPFAGGGALPLEAQRLGLESYASDLNPVAVLINKAMIEIPPKFAGKPPVNPEARSEWREERSEKREERSEREKKHALSGDDRLAESDENTYFAPYRHGSKEKAEAFFLHGMTQVMRRLAEQTHPVFPVTIYYAFKQAEKQGDTGIASTGWEIFLDAVIRAGFAVNGTWPMRTELGNRMVGSGTNALASSIVLVCRKRPANAPTAIRREFINALRTELPAALAHLQRGNIAPVDMAQASIGPGMAIFTRYAQVLESDDSPMTVRTALQLINQALDEFLSEQEGEYDSHTRFAITWFETHGMDTGPYGTAETLATARGVSVAGLVQAGILEAKGGKVRLLKREELDPDWNPQADPHPTIWECTQHLIRKLDKEGETGAATLLAKLDEQGEIARDLAYRLYQVCERKKWAEEALAYNGLVIAWPELTRLTAQTAARPEQSALSL